MAYDVDLWLTKKEKKKLIGKLHAPGGKWSLSSTFILLQRKEVPFELKLIVYQKVLFSTKKEKKIYRKERILMDLWISDWKA